MSRFITLLLPITLLILLPGCFTGIESTPPITDREVQRATHMPTPDDTYLDDVHPTAVRALQNGDLWIVNDDRISRIFDSGAYGKSFAPGDTLRYIGINEAYIVDGNRVAEVLFVHSGGDTVRYRTSRTPQALMADTALIVPFAVEATLIDQVSSQMRGREYYIVTPSRFDLEGRAYTGRKYIPVTVDSVTYGNSYYPISLIMRDDRDTPFRLYLTVGGASVMPRKFSSQLSLSNPRLRHPEITDAVWAHIVDCTVVAGMTAAECRMALGRPDDVVRQAGYSSVVELWTYPGGRALLFEDGILTTVR